MKKYCIYLLLNLLTVVFIYSDGRMPYKHVDPTAILETSNKVAINQNEIYDSEEKVEEYVNYLLNKNLLNINNSKNYRIEIFSNRGGWLISLVEKPLIKDGFIFDKFDQFEWYSFFLSKNGEIKNLSKIL